MDAFVQLWCEHAGIVRAGPDCRKYGDPYQYALAFRIADGWAEFEGLYAPIPLSVMRLAWSKVEAIGLRVTWDRCKGDRTRKVIKMHKDIPNFTVGHELSHHNPDFARGAAAIAEGKQKLTVVAVVEHGPKDRYITVHQQDLTE